MQLVRIKYTAITKTGINDFIFKGRIIQSALEKHPDVFVAPPVSPLAFAEAVKELERLAIRAGDGSKKYKSKRDLQKSIVLNIIQQTGVYVARLANEQATLIERKALVEMAGYKVCDEPNHRIGAIEPAYSLKVTTPGALGLGYVDLRWKRGGKGAYSFTIQAKMGGKDADAHEWKTIGTSFNTKFRATGLKQGIWLFRVIAQGTAGAAPPTQNAMVMVA